MWKRILRFIGFMVAGFLAGAVFARVVLVGTYSVEKASAQEAAVLPEAGVERLPEISEETPMDVPPTARYEVPPTAPTKEFGNHVTATLISAEPDGYRIDISQFVRHTDTGLKFDDVRAALAEIPRGLATSSETVALRRRDTRPLFEAREFLLLNVKVEKTSECADVQIRYDTPAPVLDEDIALLALVLDSLETQLASARTAEPAESHDSAEKGATSDE